MIAIEEAAQGFAAAGSEPRLAVLLALVRAGEGGLTVGEIQERLAIPASTLGDLVGVAGAAVVDDGDVGHGFPRGVWCGEQIGMALCRDNWHNCGSSCQLD